MHFPHCVAVLKSLSWFGRPTKALPKHTAMQKTHAEIGCGNSTSIDYYYYYFEHSHLTPSEDVPAGRFLTKL